MKKKIITIMLLPTFAVAVEYVNIISGSGKLYKTDLSTSEEDKDFTITESYTNWVFGDKTCNYDVLESEVYYGKSATQIENCQQEETRKKITTKTYSDGRKETSEEVESKITETTKTNTITGTHLENSCKNIVDNNFSDGDGSYYINHKDNTINVYCEMSRDNGGWMLVRRVNDFWYHFSDNLLGTQIVGVYEQNPLSPNTFSMKFDDFTYGEILFTTGDKQKWLITDKDSVYAGWSNSSLCNAQSTVIKSSSNPTTSKTVEWCKRTKNIEDPWISIETHDYKGYDDATENLEHSMLYGEGNFGGWDYYLKNLDGVSIYIR